MSFDDNKSWLSLLMIQNQDKFQVLNVKFNWEIKLLIQGSKEREIKSAWRLFLSRNSI